MTTRKGTHSTGFKFLHSSYSFQPIAAHSHYLGAFKIPSAWASPLGNYISVFKGGSRAFLLLKSAPGNSLTGSQAWGTIARWIQKFTLLKQSRVYALFFASQQKKSDWHFFFPTLPQAVVVIEPWTARILFLNSVGKTKEELSSWSSWQLLLLNTDILT